MRKEAEILSVDATDEGGVHSCDAGAAVAAAAGRISEQDVGSDEGQSRRWGLAQGQNLALLEDSPRVGN